MQHRPHIDGIRFFLLNGVIFFHLEIEKAFLACYFVPIFFVMSGFLICRQLIKLEGKPARQILQLFYTRRFLRIIPAHVFVLLVLAVIQGAPYLLWQLSYVFNGHMFWISMMDPQAFAWLLDHWKISNIHFWSLSVEEQFYFLSPLIVLGVSSHRKRCICLLSCIAICSSVHLAFCWYGSNLVYGVLPIVAGNYILWGSFMALIEKSEPVRCMRPSLVLSLVLLCSGVLFYMEEKPERWMLSTFIPSWYGILHAPLFAFGILSFWNLKASHPFARVFSHPVIALLGKVSYGGYLVHLAVILWMQSLCSSLGISSKLGLAFLTVIVTYLIAIMMWYTFEARINDLKDRYARIS